jgi:hypothetical protein
MKTWYKAVCDEHKEFIDIFVNNPTTTSAYLSDKDELIQLWLELHWNCRLRLIHSDFDLEDVYNRGYVEVKN